MQGPPWKPSALKKPRELISHEDSHDSQEPGQGRWRRYRQVKTRKDETHDYPDEERLDFNDRNSQWFVTYSKSR